jgi:hypothetical protein
LERPIAASAFERRLKPGVFCQFMRRCSLIKRMDKSRWAAAVGGDADMAPVLAGGA